MANKRKYLKTLGFASLALFPAAQATALSESDAEDQGRRLYERMTGRPATAEVLAEMRDHLLNGDVAAATFLAMEDLNFYKSTLLNMFAADTNVAGDTNVRLNDVLATVIGLVRNNERFDQILNGDKLYTAPDALQRYVRSFEEPLPSGQTTASPGCTLTGASAGNQICNRCVNLGQPTITVDGVRVCDPNADNNTLIAPSARSLVFSISINSDNTTPDGFVRPLLRSENRENATNIRYNRNNHFEELESRFPDYPTRLVPRSQTQINSVLASGLNAEDIMGIVTMRGLAAANFEAGTNRRVLAMMANSFLCKSLDDLKNSDMPELRIRKDVDRMPGGSAANFADCKSCHSGMDAMVGAFTFFDYRANEGRLIRDPGTITVRPPNQTSGKLARQYSVFPAGHAPTSNEWRNLYATKNAQGRPFVDLGWKTPAGGQALTFGAGAKSLGQVLAATDAFSQCMAKRVFKRICLREPNVQELNELNAIAQDFETGFSEFSDLGSGGAYNMKALFGKVSGMCFGR